ncbi:MAG: hypothetical protein J7647_09805 [Cyanobacteria bacterium SBLK]|nr:hypothetical protein [Cyanobacteria bacterium SBLK]
MLKWFLHLVIDSELHNFTNQPDLNMDEIYICCEGHSYYFSSVLLNSLNQEDEVILEAKKILKSFNGLRYILDPNSRFFRLTGKIQKNPAYMENTEKLDNTINNGDSARHHGTKKPDSKKPDSKNIISIEEAREFIRKACVKWMKEYFKIDFEERDVIKMNWNL